MFVLLNPSALISTHHEEGRDFIFYLSLVSELYFFLLKKQLKSYWIFLLKTKKKKSPIGLSGEAKLTKLGQVHGLCSNKDD